MADESRRVLVVRSKRAGPVVETRFVKKRRRTLTVSTLKALAEREEVAATTEEPSLELLAAIKRRARQLRGAVDNRSTVATSGGRPKHASPAHHQNHLMMITRMWAKPEEQLRERGPYLRRLLATAHEKGKLTDVSYCLLLQVMADVIAGIEGGCTSTTTTAESGGSGMVSNSTTECDLDLDETSEVEGGGTTAFRELRPLKLGSAPRDINMPGFVQQFILCLSSGFQGEADERLHRSAVEALAREESRLVAHQQSLQPKQLLVPPQQPWSLEDRQLINIVNACWDLGLPEITKRRNESSSELYKRLARALDQRAPPHARLFTSS